MKQKWQKFARWVKSHRLQSIALSGVLLILLTSAVAAWVWQATTPPPIDTTPLAITPRPKEKFYSPLTGVEVANQAATKQAATAVMIENSPDARPQSGLKEAGVIYEAIAEGGITRYLALYQESKPELIGPVRSLRLYNVDWLTPYNASVAHVGGSAEALQLVRNGQYRDIDQFFNASTYWRASDRYAPHNVYTSFKNIDALNKQKGYTESTFTSFPRIDGHASEKPTATRIAINFSSGQYNTEYHYDAKNNRYNRYLGGQVHKDREKGNIAPHVVVAIKVDESTVMRDGHREQITTTGSGQATVFQNGDVIEATWRKSSRGATLELLDKSGKAVELVRGQTWIAAVPNGKGSVSW